MTLRNILGGRCALAALVLGAAAFLVCECTVDRTYYDPDIALTFDPSLVSSGFGVDVWEYPEGGDAAEGADFLRGAHIVKEGDVWTPETSVLWPSRERRLCLLAHAPFCAASSVTLERGIEFKEVAIEDDMDELLFSDFIKNASKDNGGVIPISFHQAFCHIDFLIRTDAFPEEKVEITSLSILSLYTSGDFRSLPSPEWTVSGTPCEKQLFSGDFIASGESDVICENLKVIPQRLETAFHAEIDYTDTNGILSHWSVTSSTITKNLLPERHYTVTISFIVDSCSLKAE